MNFKGSKRILASVITGSLLAGGFFASPVLAAENVRNEFTLPTIYVSADNYIVPLAGGLVNETAKEGIFGNKSVLDIPYSEMSITEKSIQAFSNPGGPLQNVLVNNPSIRVSSTSPMYSDFSMRGINMNGNHMMMNGIPSLFYQFAEPRPHTIERIDITSGPNAGINGVSMSNNGTNSGATPAPGSINVVSKRAEETPVRRYTQVFTGKSSLGEYIDVGQRFGRNNSWGIRVNGEYLDGNLSFDKAKDKERNIFVNVDHRNDESNSNLFVGHWDKRVYAGQRWFTYKGNTEALPEAPDATNNYDFDGTVKYVRGWLFTLNHEHKVSDDWAMFINAGHSARTGYKYNSSASLKFDQLGNFTTDNVSNAQGEEGKNTYMQIGVHGTVETGMVKHDIALALDRSWARYWNDTHNSGKGTIEGNLYTGIKYKSTFGIPELRTPTPQWEEVNTGITLGDSMTIGKWNVLAAGSHKHEHFENQAKGQKIINDNILPTYGITYRPTDNMSIYAGHTESFSRGSVVANDPKYVNQGETLSPSVSKQNEIGLKLKGDKTLHTLSFFDIDQQSLIDQDLGGGKYKRAADGRENLRGVEFTMNGKPADKWTYTGGVMYVDNKRKKTQKSANDGKFINGVAKWSGVLGATYEPDEKWGFMGRVVTCGSAYIDNAAAPGKRSKIPAYATLDLGVTYKDSWKETPVTLSLTCFNALNKDYWQGRGSSTTIGLSSPRTFLLSASFDI